MHQRPREQAHQRRQQVERVKGTHEAFDALDRESKNSLSPRAAHDGSRAGAFAGFPHAADISYGSMSDVTRILSQIDAGDPEAAEQLLPLVYDELRKLAAARLAHEKPGQTLQATALVHEAYLRLVSSGGDRRERSEVAGQKSEVAPSVSRPLSPPSFYSRGHFFVAAAEAMRRILIEQARRKRRLKHGGGWRRVDLDSQADIAKETGHDLFALDDALHRLEQVEPDATAVVKLRYFAGFTIEETAQALDISVRTANRHWAYARAWLYQQLS
jgi:RNA polymerase sigma factor (sigma-70 family)